MINDKYRAKICYFVRVRFRRIGALSFLFVILMLSMYLILYSNLNNSTLIQRSRETSNLNEKSFLIHENGDIFLNYSKISRRRLFYDMSHEQVFCLWDTDFMGYSELNILFQKYELEVSTISTSLSHYVANMTSEDILFLNVAKYGKYTSEEINNITEFVGRGGKLIVLGEHDVLNFSAFQNPLLKNFGIEITKNNLLDYTNNLYGQPSWIVFNSSFFKLNNLSFMYGVPLNLSGSAFSVANSSFSANYPNVPVMAGYNNSIGGKVFCAPDTEWLWNCNKTMGGINYGNNSKLILKLLDWFYETNLSVELTNGLDVIPEFDLFSVPKSANFTLNITINGVLNVSTDIQGGTIFPSYGTNLIGKIMWNINVSNDGYVKFDFSKTSTNINFSKIIYFFESDSSNRIVFLHNNYSRQVNPSPDGLLKCALELKRRGFSVYATNIILNYTEFNCAIIANPQENFNLDFINALNESNMKSTRIVFLNSPYSSISMMDPMAALGKYWPGQKLFEVPINNISNIFGVNFSHYILCDSDNNSNEKIYYPKIRGINATYYNLSCYMASIMNVSSNLNIELVGYNSSWGEDRSIFGTTLPMGHDQFDINTTCAILAFNEKILASGMLNYFTNQYFEASNFFNDFFFDWFNIGRFNQKYQLKSNRTEYNLRDLHFNVYSTQVIKDFQGTTVPNGTLFNVVISKGELISEDASPLTPGFQTRSFNGSINVTCSSKEENGLFELSIYNSSSYKIILSINLIFSYVPDYDPPNLEISLLSNNTYYSSPPLILATAFDTNLFYIWYNVSNIFTKEFLENNTAEYLNDSLWSSLLEGKFDISFYANDTQGNVNNTIKFTLYKDTLNPLITINSPLNATHYNFRPIINVTVIESNFKAMWYQVGPIKVMLSNNSEVSLDLSIWNDLGEGEFDIYFYANDSAGNINNTVITKLYKDTVPPVVVVHSPIDQTYWNSAPPINATVFGSDVSFFWFNITGNSTKNFLSNNTLTYLDAYIWANILQGSFEISFYCNDSLGNLNGPISIILIKDIRNPTIRINSPINGTYYKLPPIINFTILDINFHRMWYNVTSNSTMVFVSNNSAVQMPLAIWTNLPQGEFQISFYANDSAGNLNGTIFITLFKDTIIPSITIYAPTIDDITNTEAPDYNITVIDTNLDSMWYTISGINIKFFINDTLGKINQTAWNNLSDGHITITFFANDTAGNIQSLAVVVEKLIATPNDDDDNNKTKNGDNNPSISFGLFSLPIILVSLTFLTAIKAVKNRYKGKK